MGYSCQARQSAFVDQTRQVLLYHHYAYRTEQTYWQGMLRYIYFFNGKLYGHFKKIPLLIVYENMENQNHQDLNLGQRIYFA